MYDTKMTLQSLQALGIRYKWTDWFVRPRLHDSASVWNWYEIGTDMPCVYTGSSRSAVDQFSCLVTGLTCESDPAWICAVPGWYCDRVNSTKFRRTREDPIQMEPDRAGLV